MSKENSAVDVIDDVNVNYALDNLSKKIRNMEPSQFCPNTFETQMRVVNNVPNTVGYVIMDPRTRRKYKTVISYSIEPIGE